MPVITRATSFDRKIVTGEILRTRSKGGPSRPSYRSADTNRRAWEEELVRKAARWRLLMARSQDVHEGDDDGDDYAAPDESEEPAEAEGDGTLEGLDEEHEELLANRLAAAPRDTVALLLLGLVRGNAPVQAVYLRRLFWSRPLSTAAAGRTGARIAELDELELATDEALGRITPPG